MQFSLLIDKCIIQGSFLPIPELSLFKLEKKLLLNISTETIPGKIYHPSNTSSIKINVGRVTTHLKVTNTTDRPIQVGSHYHFIETNPLLRFDRLKSYGMRLNIAAGTSVRFEPGEQKTVCLVAIAGNRIIKGGNNICDGPVSDDIHVKDLIVSKLNSEGFLNKEEVDEQFQKKQKIEGSYV